MPHWLSTLLQPRPAVAVIVVATSMTLLVVAFAFDLKNTGWAAVAYAAYVYSSYGLAVAVTWAIRIGASAYDWLLKQSEILTLAATDSDFRTFITLCAGIVVDAVYIVINTIGALSTHSTWLGTLSFYYAVLAAVNVHLIRMHIDSSHDRRRNLAQQRRCGIVLLAINAVLASIIDQIVNAQGGFSYPYYLLYGIALYAFVCLTVAIVGLVAQRKNDDVALASIKRVDLVKAIASMFFLEATMLSAFGGDAAFISLMENVTAVVVCSLELVISIEMIVTATCELARFRH